VLIQAFAAAPASGAIIHLTHTIDLSHSWHNIGIIERQIVRRLSLRKDEKK